MKILSAKQIREADQYTIQQEPIASIDLMERAANQCFNWIAQVFDSSHSMHVICGMGNNGGDGLVIARLLAESGYNCRVSQMKLGEQGSPDFETNRNRWTGELDLIESTEQLNLDSDEVLIDAVFGSGLTRPVEGWLSECFNRINKESGLVISIDLPSGLFMQEPETQGAVIEAQFTLSFENPKLPFLLPDTGPFCGEWVLLDIGLNKEFIESVETSYFWTNAGALRNLIRPRPRFAHKGVFGHTLLIAGSKGKMGAAVLGARSCLRSGTGLLTVHVPGCGYSVLQSTVPEAMCITDSSETEWTTFTENLETYRAVAVGPGIGTSDVTFHALDALVSSSDQPLVLDADALNLLAANNRMSAIPPGSVLTPHPGEFKRLCGAPRNSYHQLEQLQDLARRLQCVVLLKGAYTAIASPEGHIHFNSTGNPGMATGGSGDVLTGIIAGLIAQGYDSLSAALLGAYWHGLAGDLAMDFGGPGLIAGDLIEHLSLAWQQLIEP